jgi:hypothetical protein
MAYFIEACDVFMHGFDQFSRVIFWITSIYGFLKDLRRAISIAPLKNSLFLIVFVFQIALETVPFSI